MDTHSLPDDSYWTKGLKRNRAVVALLRLPLTPWVKWRYRYRCKKYTPKDKTFLLLTNHTSTADHFMNAMGVKGYMRFVASDHLMRKGFLSSVLRFLVNPIPRRKAVSGEATTQMILQNLEKDYTDDTRTTRRDILDFRQLNKGVISLYDKALKSKSKAA